VPRRSISALVFVVLALASAGCLRLKYDRCEEAIPHPDCFDAAADAAIDGSRGSDASLPGLDATMEDGGLADAGDLDASIVDAATDDAPVDDDAAADDAATDDAATDDAATDDAAADDAATDEGPSDGR
jgi:hypothetical protein